jgi:hypothetical protein
VTGNKKSAWSVQDVRDSLVQELISAHGLGPAAAADRVARLTDELIRGWIGLAGMLVVIKVAAAVLAKVG